MRLRTWAAGSAVALAATASAQTSVVLSGVADAAVRSVSNAGSGTVQSMVSGSNSTSRLVFRGTEALGGGLSAGFWLETGIAVDSGSSTTATQFLPLLNSVWVESKVFWLAAGVKGAKRRSEPLTPAASLHAGRLADAAC